MSTSIKKSKVGFWPFQSFVKLQFTISLLFLSSLAQAVSLTVFDQVSPFGSSVSGVSDNGLIAVTTPTASDTSGLLSPSNAYVWQTGVGYTKLPLMASQNTTYAAGISADGSTVVGGSYARPSPHVVSNEQAVRWTRNQGIQTLGALPGHNNSGAVAVSGDGAVTVGNALNADFTPQAFRWTAQTGMVGCRNLAGT